MSRSLKDSGVAWIGEMPSEWNLYTVGSLFNVRNEKVNDTDYPPLSVTRGGVVPQMENVAKSDANDNRKQVLKNDFVINSRSDRKQSCGVSSLDGSVSLINTVLFTKNNTRMISRYPSFLMKNYGFAEEFYRWGHGIVADLWTTRWQEMKNICLPVPTIDEQKRILAEMVRRTQKIDKLIDNQQKQIETLKQYKHSMITEVVTKGLNPDVEMKDSEIEWIGNTPSKWNFIATKKLFKLESGATPKSEVAEYWDGNIKWITPADYKTEDKYVDCGRRNLTQEGYDACSTTLIPKNSIIFSKRAPIGAVVINREELCTNQGCLSCIPIRELCVEYYYYVMSVCTEIYNLLGSGTTFKEISSSSFGNFILPMPSIKEQIEISNYLNLKTDKINSLIEIKHQKIEKLNQYKKSIIYEYVTGKKEA